MTIERSLFASEDRTDEDGYTFRPCVGSGTCCKEALCHIGLMKHGTRPGPCPSLVFDREADRHWCGEVLKAEGAEKEALAARLYIGGGCCSPLGNTARNLIILRRRARDVGTGDP